MASRFLGKILLAATLIVCSLSALSIAAAPAPAISHLMTAQLPNPSSNQQQNFQAALAQVLIKATGNPNVMTLPMIRSGLTHVANMVKSYSTTNNPLNPNQQALEVSFDPKAIKKLLTAAGQPMWDAKRPTTLIWLAVNNNGQNSVLDSSAAKTQPVAMNLQQDAQQRGLPIFFPLLDLSDQQLIASNLKKTTPLDTTDLQSLANRYHVDSVLAGSLTQVGNQWQAQWRYLLDNAPINWNQDPSNAQNIAKQAMDTVANTMVAQLTISTTSNVQTEAYLQINQVSNLQTYSQLSQCLTKLSNMTNLAPVDLNDNQVTFHAHFNGNSNQMIQTVSKKCGLTYQANQPGENNKNNLPSNLQQTKLAVFSFTYAGTTNV